MLWKRLHRGFLLSCGIPGNISSVLPPCSGADVQAFTLVLQERCADAAGPVGPGWPERWNLPGDPGTLGAWISTPSYPVFELFVEALAIGAGVVAALGAGTGVAGWLVVRRIRRTRIIERTRDRGMLAARAYAPDRLTREPARLIVELQRSSRATHGALAEAAAQGRPIGDLPRAAAEIDRAAASLESLLRTADREPNRALKQEWTSDLGAQARALDELSADLRRCLLQTSRSIDTWQLEQATGRLRTEISAMATWRDSYGNRQEG